MSFQQGLSGLDAAARNLDVIGNNVANANTVGAKQSRAEFTDVYANSLAGAGSSAVGIGVAVSAVAQQFTQGDITTTSNPLDLAINGSGFFQLTMPNGTLGYTRDGQFKLDATGNIVTDQGAHLMGYMTDPATGNLGQIASAMALNVGGGTPKMTDGITIGLNLNAQAPATTFDIKNSSTTSNGATSVTVYSPQGEAHTMQIYFSRNGGGTPPTATNNWDLNYTLDNVAASLSKVSLAFNPDGTLDTTTTKSPLSLPVVFPATEGGAASPGDTINLDVSNVTQFGSQFAVTEMSQTGYGPGDLAGFSIGSDGMIEARYSNGATKAMGQVTLANFPNPQGLAPLGGSCWAQTASSGDAVKNGTPGTGNFGLLQSGALEQSNVDLTAELVNMITAQRVYQANAQTIKAQDQLMQTIVNLR